MDFNKEQAIKELERLNKQAQEASKLLAEANGKKKIHEEEIKTREEELRKMGIDPSKVDETLNSLIAEYEKKLSEVKAMIPTEILEKVRRV